MKKHFLFGALAAVMFSFCACEPEEIIDFDDIIEEGIYGSATFYVTNNDGTVETLEFSSAITDIYTKDSNDNSCATIALCANVHLKDGEFAFPYAAFQMDDTIAKSYPCYTILTQNLLADFCYDSVAALLRRPCGSNLLLIGKEIPGANDTAWYISDSGSVVVTNYPTMGHNMEGTVTSMKMLYFTTRQLENNREAIEAAVEAGTFDIHDYAVPCYVSATFRCRRAAIIQDIIDQFNQQQENEGK